MENRIAKLERELNRAYRGWKDGVVPDSMFLADQERIAEEQRLITGQLETIQEHLAQSDEMAVLGVECAKKCGTTYREASPEVKRLFAQSFFERIIVRDGRLVNVTFNEPFASFFDSSVKDRWRRHTGTKPNSSDLGLRRLRELGTLVDPT